MPAWPAVAAGQPTGNKYMYYGSGTGGYCAAYVPGRCWICTHWVAALYCMKWCHGHHLKVWHCIWNLTLVSLQQFCVYFYLLCTTNLLNIPARFRPAVIWNDLVFALLMKKVAPTRRTRRKNNKMSSDMRSIPKTTEWIITKQFVTQHNIREPP